MLVTITLSLWSYVQDVSFKYCRRLTIRRICCPIKFIIWVLNQIFFNIFRWFHVSSSTHNYRVDVSRIGQWQLVVELILWVITTSAPSSIWIALRLIHWHVTSTRSIILERLLFYDQIRFKCPYGLIIVVLHFELLEIWCGTCFLLKCVLTYI